MTTDHGGARADTPESDPLHPRKLDREVRSQEEIRYDVFISHASNDKASFVRPLALALHRRGLVVWYDEFTLKVGDSLRRSIERGLSGSRFGIVVISPSFISKQWPAYELDGLLSKEVAYGGKVILPVWYGIDREAVLKYSPLLADRVALDSGTLTIDEIAFEVAACVRELATQARARDDLMPGDVCVGRVFEVTPEGVSFSLAGGRLGWVLRAELPRVGRTLPLSPGQQHHLLVIAIDPSDSRVYLKPVEREPNPWYYAEQKYKQGSHVSGLVIELHEDYAVLDLEPVITARLDLEEMSWTDHLRHPRDMLAIGQHVDAVVKSNYGRETNRGIVLSLRPLLINPWESDIPGRYHVGQKISRRVTQRRANRFFVMLDPNLEVRLRIFGYSQAELAAATSLPDAGEEFTATIFDVDKKDRCLVVKCDWDPVADGVWVTREVIIAYEYGLDTIPIQHLMRILEMYESESVHVTTEAGGTEANCRSVLDLFTLAAEAGTRLIFRAAGPRAGRCSTIWWVY